MAKKLSNKEFIEKCVTIHGDKFDYTNTNYINSRTKIKIICKKHGEFEISPDNHSGKKPQGCNLCARENHKLIEITNERLEKLKKIHNNYYEYKDLSVTDGYINIICPIHGEFKQSIFNHEYGHKCAQCAGTGFKLTNLSNLRLNKLKKIHNNKYTYDDLSVTNGFINIICPIHGKFRQTIFLHENGSGCELCGLIKRSKNIKEFNLLNPKNPVINGEKACIDCAEIKSVNLFPLRNKKDIESHRNQCIDCFYEKQKITDKNYRQTNKKEIRRKDIIYRKNRMETDPLYKVTIIARTIIRKSLTKMGYTKNSRTFDILGCSYEDFKNHIENQFLEGMNWENRDKWHIDHIVPLSFCENEEECIKLNNYKNLRPMWIIDNQEKSNFITEKTELYYEIIEGRNV